MKGTKGLRVSSVILILMGVASILLTYFLAGEAEASDITVSESEALRRGTEIQNKELDYVLDWNEEHPDNQIQPEINYFRVYPSAIDENGKYWYYLHFFCRSGEGLDQELKSKY